MVKSNTILLNVVILSSLLMGSACFAAEGTRVANLRGQRIPSIFFGARPNARFARVYKSLINRAGYSPSCSVQKAVLRNTDRPARLLRVQTECYSHYMLCEDRSCGSSCGGGMEQWCYADDLQPCTVGYGNDMEGCATRNCQEEHECFQTDCP
jgi:hypothetical protein